MNTSEQLKNEAIRKAWIAEIGEEKLSRLTGKIDKNGYYWQYFYDFVDTSHMDYLQQHFDGVNGRIEASTYRPKSLSGIETNNGWIRIEPDGSNLPIESQENFDVCYLKSDGSFAEIKNQMCYQVVSRFKNPHKFHVKITHYKQIEKSKPPIF